MLRYPRITFLGLLLLSSACWAEKPVRLGFVFNKEIVVLLGQWNGRWEGPEHIQGFPQPTSTFTLFDAKGRIAPVTLTDAFLPSKKRSSWDWTGQISSWPKTPERFYAVAIEGAQLDLPRRPDPLPLTEAETLGKQALADCGVVVAKPLIQSAVRIDLNGDGHLERLITTHSDRKTFTDDYKGPIYALAFIVDGEVGRISAVSAYCTNKPSQQSLEDHWRSHGAFPFYRFAALTDVNQDDRLEVTVYASAGGDTQIDFLTFHEGQWQKSLGGWIGY
jgi:hypothetical protein